MDKDYLKSHYYNKISRNEIIENDKFDIIQKFGFSSFMSSTSIHSIKKSFIEEKSVKTEATQNNNCINKSSIKKNKSANKPTIIKIKTVKNNQTMIKLDFPMNINNNKFSYTQKIDFKENKKKNKIFISPNDFPNSNSLQNYSSKTYNNNSNNKTNSNINKNKSKIKIKSIIFNQTSLLKNKYFNEKNNFYEYNSNNKNSNSNEMPIINNEINMSTKRELYNNKQILYFDNNSNNKEEEQYYNINKDYSSEYISKKNNMQKYRIIEPCKNFNSLEDNLYELKSDISESISNDNNMDKNSILFCNANNKNLNYLINKKKKEKLMKI